MGQGEGCRVDAARRWDVRDKSRSVKVLRRENYGN